jgi:DNA-directed RNA polymerase subunit RPC12/RpoP
MKSDLDGPAQSAEGVMRFKCGSVVVPPDRCEVPPPTSIATATANPNIPAKPDIRAKEDQMPHVNPAPQTATAKGGRLVSDLAEIRAVAFRCGECQTIVSLPRIRWVNSPENCPNCGSRWMHQPSPDTLLPEDESTYVYRVVSSFREALQRLIKVKQDAAFQLLLEFDAPPNHGNGFAEHEGSGRSRSSNDLLGEKRHTDAQDSTH